MKLQGSKVAVFGATSGIARVLCREMAARGASLHLLGRDAGELERLGGDLALRYRVPATWSTFDALAYERHAEALDRAHREMGGLNGVVLAFGFQGTQRQAQVDVDHAMQIAAVNYLGALSILTHAANRLEEAGGGGFLLAITSVAGERGRRKNYVYGSAKAALSVLLQGLRHRLAGKGVKVVDVRPGPVDTRMTRGMDVPLLASPEDVGRAIVKSLECGRETIYVPWFWSPIMAVLRNLPQGIFNRLDL